MDLVKRREDLVKGREEALAFEREWHDKAMLNQGAIMQIDEQLQEADNAEQEKGSEGSAEVREIGKGKAKKG